MSWRGAFQGAVSSPDCLAQTGLLAASAQTGTARALMKHRLQVVRGRAILDCLARVKEPWALAALEHEAPYVLAFRLPE
jgi:hypothetical protein